VNSLWERVARERSPVAGEFKDRASVVAIAELEQRSMLGAQLESLRGRSVLLATREQLATALALLELDGVARRIVLCTPDLAPELLREVAITAAADAILADELPLDCPGLDCPGLSPYLVSMRSEPGMVPRRASEHTQWILLTSGTTGRPKLVVHTLESLAGALPTQSSAGDALAARSFVWSTFYDIRRYGGLQIYLRAVLSGSPLVLSCPDESTHDYLVRAAAAGVTHISGTPSHWRRVLMSGDAPLLSPQYVRLSGEVANQALLDGLKAIYPQARVAHAFASTEAGVAFDVNDGLAGFPADLVGGVDNALDLKIENGTLRIRSGRNAARYLEPTSSGGEGQLAHDDGYVDTGDLVELQNGRYYFRGRRGGVINVGGLKVFPEEVESVLNADPRVQMSLVRARRNPITGAVVAADVVLTAATLASASHNLKQVKGELLSSCRRSLPSHKVPAILRFVPALELTAAGKLVRADA
jgi:acyl-coenzyme A synthetase/AMP-(fatty) acid ligase